MKPITKVTFCAVMLVLMLSTIYVGVLHSDGISKLFGNNYNTEAQKTTQISQIIQVDHLPLRIQTPVENIIINISIPASPPNFPYYKAYYQQGDVVEKYYQELGKIRYNETPADVAPELAKSALGPYGGLPPDAVLAYSKVNYLEGRNDTAVVQRIPMFTQVLFTRAINGTPIVGMEDSIGVIFGENGEVLTLIKHWRTLENKGTVPIIPVEKAIKKLEQREIINPPQGPEDAVVTSINLRYYAKSWNTKEIYLEPVWEFYATMPSGEPYQFYVYARQFANFTATPTSGKVPLNVTFTDTSDASPVKWYWSFGDGTNSTVQNPVHPYTTAGTYNVSLRAWNDLGSDTMEKSGYILIGKKAIVMHTGTELDELIMALNAMEIQQGIKNSLTQKLENAKAKNSDALKFIDQNKETQANSMLTAEDNLVQAFVNEVDAQTGGKAISSEDAKRLKDSALNIRELIQKAIGIPI